MSAGEGMQVIDGIPVFLRFSEVQRELDNYPRERQAVELARAKGWRHALEAAWDAGMLAYAGERKRLQFLEVVPLSKEMFALEIGTGLGQHTAEIASRVAHLDSLETRLVNALFAKARCEEEHVNNVTFTCGGDDCRLPFPDRRFDVVLFNLVFEWCAGDSKEESHETAQRRMLAEIHRVLKPAGFIQLNTKNRYAFRLLTGAADEHSFHMPFGSALPRWLLRFLLFVQGKPRPPGYLYSWRALRRLLLDVGFANVVSYWAIPEMRFPEHFVLTDAPAVRAARRRISQLGEMRRTNLLMQITPAGLVKHFTPGLFFIGRKDFCERTRRADLERATHLPRRTVVIRDGGKAAAAYCRRLNAEVCFALRAICTVYLDSFKRRCAVTGSPKCRTHADGEGSSV
jgi:SAM-dependent methyltransferase